MGLKQTKSQELDRSTDKDTMANSCINFNEMEENLKFIHTNFRKMTITNFSSSGSNKNFPNSNKSDEISRISIRTILSEVETEVSHNQSTMSHANNNFGDNNTVAFFTFPEEVNRQRHSSSEKNSKINTYPKWIRESYFTKLKYNGYWPEESLRKHNSIFIFDWDDTLMCTNFLNTRNRKNLQNPSILEKIRTNEHILNMENIVSNLLRKAIERGDVYIISNASQEWILKSMRTVFPMVYDNYYEHVKIISARDSFEKKFPFNFAKWKSEVLNRIANYYDKDLLTNIMIIGDSLNDIKSGEKFGKYFKNAYIKTIKFKDMPDINTLTRQLKLLEKNFPKLNQKVKNMKIIIEPNDVKLSKCKKVSLI